MLYILCVRVRCVGPSVPEWKFSNAFSCAFPCSLSLKGIWQRQRHSKHISSTHRKRMRAWFLISAQAQTTHTHTHSHTQTDTNVCTRKCLQQSPPPKWLGETSDNNSRWCVWRIARGRLWWYAFAVDRMPALLYRARVRLNSFDAHVLLCGRMPDALLTIYYVLDRIHYI